MKRIDLLYQNYAAEQLAKGRTIQQRKVEYEVMRDFLEFHLNPDDYLEAENLLNDLVLTIEEESFCAGMKYLPQLLKELTEELKNRALRPAQ